MALPGGFLVRDAAGARGAGALEVREGETQCTAECEGEVLRGEGEAGARGGRREKGEKAAFFRAGEDAVCRHPAVEGGGGDVVEGSQQ